MRAFARVTLSDVARVAGVSAMTVSRVVNNRGEVNPQTRARILEAIDHLGYRPNALARGLITQKTHTVGLVVPDLTNPVFPEIIRGAEDVALREGYTLYIGNINEQPERERTALQRFEASQVDGIIVCASRLPDDELQTLLARYPASVVINREVPGELSAVVLNDDRYGVMQAVHHLLQRGHQAVGLLAGPPASRSARLRLQGFQMALGMANRAVVPQQVLICDPNEEGGYRGLPRLLQQFPEVDAVVCYNDLVALGVLQACQEQGLAVPGQLAVIGFDDIRMARLATPALSTIRVNRYELGRLAFELLLGRLANHPDLPLMVRPELVVRHST